MFGNIWPPTVPRVTVLTGVLPLLFFDTEENLSQEDETQCLLEEVHEVATRLSPLGKVQEDARQL